MLKQIISYQRFLIEANFKAFNNGVRIKIFRLLGLMLLIDLLSQSSYADLSLVIISLAIIYHTYVTVLDRKAMPTASVQFAIFNAFLFAFVITIAIRILISIAIPVVSIPFMLIYFINGLIFGFGSPAPDADILINFVKFSWQSLALTSLFIIIVLFISTTITLIPKHKTRKIALAIFMMITSVLLRLMYAQIPDYNYSCTLALLPDLLVDDYSKLQHANQILLAMGLACLVILPASFYAGLRFYRQRMKQGVN